MKNFFLIALAIVIMMFSACNSKTDELKNNKGQDGFTNVVDYANKGATVTLKINSPDEN